MIIKEWNADFPDDPDLKNQVNQADLRPIYFSTINRVVQQQALLGGLFAELSPII
jgi:hypothetical protein